MASIQTLGIDEPVLGLGGLGTVAALAPDDGYLKVIQAFGEVAAAIGDFRELDGLLHLVAEKITDLVGVRRCSLYLRDEASGLYRGQVGHWHQDIDQRVKRLVSGVHADRFTAQILATRRPVVVQDTGSDPRPIQSAMREWHVRSMLGVPMIVREEVIGIVYLDDEDRPRFYGERDSAIAFAFAGLAAVAISQARLTADLRQRLDTVVRQNRAMRRAADVEDRLTRLAIDGGTVQEIAEAVVELTGKSVSIHDADHRRIAGAAPGSDAKLLPRLLEPAVRSHPRVVESLQSAGSGEPIVVGPVLEAGLHRRSLLAPVRVRSETWGSLVIAEHHSRLSRADLQIGRRAATIVAWELSAERRAMAAEEDARSTFVLDLLSGTRDRATLERRACHLRIELARSRIVCLVAAEHGAVRPDINTVQRVFAAAAGPDAEVLVADTPDGIAVLLGLDDGADGIDDLVGRACAALGPVGSLRAGVSGVCHDAAVLPAARDVARQVLRCLRTFCAADVAVLTDHDLGPGRILFACCDPAEVDRFAEEAIGALLGGGAGERKLLETLATFIDSGHSVRNAAAELKIHENSVRYRLSRIEELTGLRVLTDAEGQLGAQLAIMALRLRGTLPRRAR
jgi:GAF domain-containing protein